MRDKWAKKRMRRRQRKKRKMKKWTRTDPQGMNSTCNVMNLRLWVGRHSSEPLQAESAKWDRTGTLRAWPRTQFTANNVQPNTPFSSLSLPLSNISSIHFIFPWHIFLRQRLSWHSLPHAFEVGTIRAELYACAQQFLWKLSLSCFVL